MGDLRRYENECCDCAVPSYPCVGSYCPRRNVLRVYCDVCGDQADKMYAVGDDDVCEDCLCEYLLENGIIKLLED